MSIIDMLLFLGRIFVVLTFVKAMIIGSDFSFYWWFKDGDRYLTWYKNRSKYGDN